MWQSPRKLILDFIFREAKIPVVRICVYFCSNLSVNPILFIGVFHVLFLPFAYAKSLNAYARNMTKIYNNKFYSNSFYNDAIIIILVPSARH